MRAISFWLSLLLIFTIPMEESIAVDGFGTLTKIIGLLLAAFWVIAFVISGKHRKPHFFHVVVYFFVVWNISSYFWSLDPNLTVTRILTYFQMLALAVILWDLYPTSTELQAGLQAYILGAYVSSGSTISNYLVNSTYRGMSYDLRFSGSGLDPNELALMLVLGIPIAWHLAVSEATSRASFILKILNYIYIPTALFAILLTASRTALFTSIPAILYILGTFFRLKLPALILIFVGMIVALVVLQPYIPQTSLDRLATTQESIETGNLSRRVEIWMEGVEVFFNSPFIGVGSGAFRTAVEIHKVAHNTYLSVLVEVGAIGFIIFLIILAVAAYHTVYQSATRTHKFLWLTILLIWSIGVVVLSWEYKKPTWLFLSFIVISAHFSPVTEKAIRSSVSLPRSLQLGESDATAYKRI